ncbi:MAG TPA: D-alanyl-D-alanine carboxypeptidase [Candidatus Egerieimonas intestinavium]|uniref:serine-type D-Ala-D-Ala carboxypeptidase n=1 Tax=Candidatus Egerieimonas intestinavium TaxID=2840777 RepID=A0A9D1EL77_9FIRM|nr:D-alanyl-D-alanine carboxypeptidase [Candidatus Egerieimonas intestinavium]
MKKMSKVIAALGVFLQFFFLGIRAASGGEAPGPTELYAKAACLLDGDSGRVLYGKEENLALPMASTTKIMTCILVLESGTEEEMATVSSRAAGQPKVHLGVRKGETYRVGDLLYSLMLESHNDAAVILAEHVGTTVEGFAAMMNQKAEEIGCEDTYFITPNGLDASDDQGVHHTTAADLARIMRYCIRISPKKAEFLEITGTASYTFTDGSGSRSFSCYNHNTFLDMMEGALSGKTGFTADAGYCYVGALEREGRTFIVALLACGWPNNKTYKWSDTKKLMVYGLENYQYRDVFQKGQEFPALPVSGGQAELVDELPRVQVGLNIPSEEQQLTLLLREDEEVRVETELPQALAAPVEAGSPVGAVRYYLGEELVGEYPLYTLSQVKKIDFDWCFDIIKKRFLHAVRE